MDYFFRVTPLGEPPTPRAAHVATAVGTMVVIQVSFCQIIPLKFSSHAESRFRFIDQYYNLFRSLYFNVGWNWSRWFIF